MEAIIKSIVEKVRHLKNNTDEVIIEIDVKTPLDDEAKTDIRLKLKTIFTDDSIYFLTNSNKLIVDWSISPPLKTKRQKTDINSNTLY